MSGWTYTAPRNDVTFGGADARIHAPHPTRPGDSYTLAEVYGFSETDAEGRARLMSAAPELLAALKDLHDAVHSGGFPHQAIAAARAAIARAEAE